MSGSPESSPDADAGDSGATSADRSFLPDRLHEVSVVQAVVAVALLALLARFVLLGARTFHWDEARVGYWILHTIDTGHFAYRRIIHGPFIQHVNHLLFPLFGASDFVARAPVALIGGLLPLSALLFREYLEDDETVILALFLAFNAVLVYYGRFMRSDVLVAAFMFTALGLLLRFYDARKPRYLYAAALLIALGFGSKENAIVYVLTWVGAAVLLADQALYRPRDVRSGGALLKQKFRSLRGWRPSSGRSRGAALGVWGGHLLGAALVFLLVTVFLYGPRGGGLDAMYYPPIPAGEGGPGFFGALAQPTTFPGYAYDALAHLVDEFGQWFSQSSDPGCNKDNVIDGWLCYLGRYAWVMISSSFVLSVFAILGFVYERYGRAVSRNLVMFAAYAGFVSILGYPLGTDVFGAWIVVHAVVPLAIPAAVGVAPLYRWGKEAAVEGDDVGKAVSVLVLVLLAGGVAAANVTTVYTNYGDDSNPLVQYAQPADDLDPVIEAMQSAAGESGNQTDVVLYYGEIGSNRDEHVALVKKNPGWAEGDLLTRPRCAEWFNALPLPWYFETTGANVSCMSEPTPLGDRALSNGPGVIITMASDQTVPGDRLREAGYRNATYRMRSNDYRINVFVHERIEWDPRAE